MQGLVVVPLFAGFDEDTGKGRIFSYDVAGGRYEEHRFHAIGSGSVFARGSLKKLYTDGMSAEADAVTACMQALYDAADDDSATGGPDLTRRIYPVVAMVTADGFRRLTDDEAGEYAQAVVGERMQSPGGPIAPLRQANVHNDGPGNSSAHTIRGAPAVSMPFYVSPEQQMKDKADYARKGIARGRNSVVLDYDEGILFVAPNPSRALHKISEIYDRIAFAAVGRYNEYENLRKAGVRFADTTGATSTTGRTSPRAGWPTGTRRSSAASSPRATSRTRWRSWSPRWGRTRTATRSTGSPSTARSPTSTASSPWAARPTRSPGVLKDRYRDGMPLWRPSARPSPPCRARATGSGRRNRRQPAGGGRSGPRPGAPFVPAAHRSPAGRAARRGRSAGKGPASRGATASGPEPAGSQPNPDGGAVLAAPVSAAVLSWPRP